MSKERTIYLGKGEERMVEQNKQLKMENVLSLRKKMTQMQLQQEMTKIGEFLQQQSVKKSGYIVTATFSVEIQGSQQLMDVEILVPLDRKIELPEEYTFKPVFNLVNALSIRYEGSPVNFQSAINQLNEYIQANNQQVITATYNVMVKEATSEDDMNDMIIDVYVGVNPSIL